MDDIKTTFSACKCNECEKIEAYHRLGCSCWDMDKISSSEYQPQMTYGFFVSDDRNFVSCDEIQQHIIKGGKAFDPSDNEITLAMFED